MLAWLLSALLCSCSANTSSSDSCLYSDLSSAWLDGFDTQQSSEESKKRLAAVPIPGVDFGRDPSFKEGRSISVQCSDPSSDRMSFVIPSDRIEFRCDGGSWKLDRTVLGHLELDPSKLVCRGKRECFAMRLRMQPGFAGYRSLSKADWFFKPGDPPIRVGCVDGFVKSGLNRKGPTLNCEVNRRGEGVFAVPPLWREMHHCVLFDSEFEQSDSPPSDGCSGLDSELDCRKYGKYCSWPTSQKGRLLTSDVPGGMLEECVQSSRGRVRCVSLVCYAAMDQKPECETADSSKECTDGKFAFFCQWHTQSAECRPSESRARCYDGSRRKPSNPDCPRIRIDSCEGSSRSCSKSIPNSQWLDLDQSFEGALFGSLAGGTLKFGWDAVIIAFRHVVTPIEGTFTLGMMAGIRGSGVATEFKFVQRDPDHGGWASDGDSRAKVTLDPGSHSSSFDLTSAAKFKVLSKLMSVTRVRRSQTIESVMKPVPDFVYVRAHLNSQFWDESVKHNPQNLHFLADTHLQKRCVGCFLEMYTRSRKGDVSGNVHRLEYDIQMGQPDRATVNIDRWIPKPGQSRKYKIRSEPGPEDCNPESIIADFSSFYDCYVSFSPRFDSVADSVFKIRNKLPLKAVWKGLPRDSPTIVGVLPDQRRRTKGHFQVKTVSVQKISEFVGQSMKIGWDSAEYGSSKAISAARPEGFELTISPSVQSKIEWRVPILLRTNPMKYACLRLTLKSMNPEEFRMNADFGDKPVLLKPKNILVRRFALSQRLCFTMAEPGSVQIKLEVDGQARQWVQNPPPISLRCIQSAAGFVWVPQTQGKQTVLNGQWALLPIVVRASRKPVRKGEKLVITPVSDDFLFEPNSADFTQRGLSVSFRFKAQVECGGGMPYRVDWSLSGAIQEFYPPTFTMIDVRPGSEDEPACINHILKMEAVQMNESVQMNRVIQQTDPQNNTSQSLLLEATNAVWRFEYFLIGGASAVCILVAISQLRNDKTDRLVALMSQI